MGKASRWFRSLLGLKSSSDSHKQNKTNNPNKQQQQRKWSFVKSYREKQTTHNNTTTTTNASLVNTPGEDPNKHAIAVAAATAAAAEAAVSAAAHAAATVARLTSGSGRRRDDYTSVVRQDLAAVKIQSAFRGYLSRRALRALKGLVRLQALVRGHIVRKQTAEWLRQMQALLRAQARARAGRFQVSDSPYSSGKSSYLTHPGPATPEKFEHTTRARSINYDQPSVFMRNWSNPNVRIIDDQDRKHSSWNWSDYRRNRKLSHHQLAMNMCSVDEQTDDKILEVDSGKSHTVPKCKNDVPSNQQYLSRDHDSLTVSKDSTTHLSVPNSYSCEVQSLCPFNFSNEIDEGPFCTATNSPHIFSASSRGGSSRRSPFTSIGSDGSRSYLSGYSDCPSYMAYTECSRAKVRSLSAPKQRPQYERSSSTKRHSVHGFAETKSNADKVSSLHTSFMSKAYPGSGRLDRLGMPVRGNGLGYRY